MRRKFHLNKRDGKLMGVCAGLADYTGIDPLWIRIATVLAVVTGFGSLLLLYLIVGLAANDRPVDVFDCHPPLAGPNDMDRWRGDVEHYYAVSNARLSRTIDGLS